MTDNIQARMQKLFATAELPGLVPEPRPGVRPVKELEAELNSVLAGEKIPPASRELIRALVLLWHDQLDPSHVISQSIENRDGSLLHAMMHRREPDYWNSKYWWRRVGQHPCFVELGKRVAALLEARGEAELRDQLVPCGQWDAPAFVDACEAAAGEGRSSRRQELLREVQRLETEVVLAYLLRGA